MSVKKLYHYFVSATQATLVPQEAIGNLHCFSPNWRLVALAV
jgi:hypothetical protein